jgi:hypothetical protein
MSLPQHCVTQGAPRRVAAGHESCNHVSRRPLDGPVIADLAAAATARIAAMDAAAAAMVLGGGARNAAELRGWLEMAGLLEAPPWWCAA